MYRASHHERSYEGTGTIGTQSSRSQEANTAEKIIAAIKRKAADQP